jgi:hypothetical protein
MRKRRAFAPAFCVLIRQRYSTYTTLNSFRKPQIFVHALEYRYFQHNFASPNRRIRQQDCLFELCKVFYLEIIEYAALSKFKYNFSGNNCYLRVISVSKFQGDLYVGNSKEWQSIIKDCLFQINKLITSQRGCD